MADGPFFLQLVGKAGYVGRYDVRTDPSDEEVRFVLKRSLRLKGVVRDASTGQAFFEGKDGDVVEAGLVDPETGAIQWKERHRLFDWFEESLDAEAPCGSRLRFTAAGYKPFVSREFKGDERR